MKIIEVRDGFIKFEADDSIYLSSFIQVNGTNKSYIAQVNRFKKIGSVCLCSAKILFIVVNGELRNYDKTEPVKDAEVKAFDFGFLQDLVKIEKPIIAGKTLDDKYNITIDSSAFNKKMLICVDGADTNNIIVRNLSRQFENLNINTVVIDTPGVINAKKYTAGKDFKLPLDKSVLEFLYKYCLNDVTVESKNTIIEIFKDLSEYADSVPFVPFKMLKYVVDDLVNKQHIFKLFVLKNKLAKFEQLGYFATTENEVKNIDKILESKLSIIDLSKLDILFQNYFIEYIYKNLNNKNVQVFFEASNNVSKKSLKTITIDSNIPTALIVNSRFQYLNNIKNMFDNFIIEGSAQNSQLFKLYSSFFECMKPDSYLITGENINYIPMVSKVQIIDDYITIKNETSVISESENVLPEESINVNLNEHISEEVSSIEEQDTSEIQDEQEVEVVQPLLEIQEYSVLQAESVEENKLVDEEPVNEDSDIVELEETLIKSNEEVISNIDEHSNDTINSISESLDEQQDIDLFSDNVLNDNENSEVEQEQIIDLQDNDTIIIEPEYNEIEDSAKDLIQEENIINQTDLDKSNILQYNEELQEDIISDNLNSIEDDDIVKNAELSASDFEEETEVSSNEFVNEQSAIDDLTESTEEIALELNKDDELLLQDMSDENSEDNSILPEDISVPDPEPIVTPLNDDDEWQNIEEIVELDDDDVAADTDIIVDIADENNDGNAVIDEEKEREISADVDKMYTTLKSNDELEEISDSDLDFIDELNSEEEVSLDEFTENAIELQESRINEELLEQPQESIIPEKQQVENNTGNEILEKRDSNTPIVPVYDAEIPPEDMVVSDHIQQGDSVVHAKYGNGVVEKMIKYGNKTLFSINFENIGRRLLDPTLTEIKRV